MPETIELTVYSFDELSERAKDKAREKRRYYEVDRDWWNYTYEAAVEVAARMGIIIHNKGSNGGPAICFSGFSSQGDGTSFEGVYAYVPDSVAKISAYAPGDKELQHIAESLAVIQTATYLESGGRISASITVSGSYRHSGTMQVECQRNGPDSNPFHNDDDQVDADVDGEVTTLLRAFADWIYEQLEAEHDYLTSDEHIDEGMVDLKFNEDGDEI